MKNKNINELNRDIDHSRHFKIDTRSKRKHITVQLTARKNGV